MFTNAFNPGVYFPSHYFPRQLAHGTGGQYFPDYFPDAAFPPNYFPGAGSAVIPTPPTPDFAVTSRPHPRLPFVFIRGIGWIRLEPLRADGSGSVLPPPLIGDGALILQALLAAGTGVLEPVSASGHGQLQARALVSALRGAVMTPVRPKRAEPLTDEEELLEFYLDAVLSRKRDA